MDKCNNELIIVCNFAGVKWSKYRIGVEEGGLYNQVFSSDDKKYGGGGIDNTNLLAESIPMDGYANSVEIELPPLSTLYFACKSI
jgi:1,4-alpha-glucan branching enzyme